MITPDRKNIPSSGGPGTMAAFRYQADWRLFEHMFLIETIGKIYHRPAIDVKRRNSSQNRRLSKT
jgi:hypothetical protein